MKKKIWALLMTIMMIVGMVPASVFAETAQAPNPTQIGDYYDVDKEDGNLKAAPSIKEGATQMTYADGAVKVNKTITATDEENVFDVNLEVVTTEKIETTELTADAAVVLVIDCSYSMTQNNSQRLATAKKAAQTFINGFVAENANRKVAIVKFSGYDNENTDGAETVQAWTDAKELKTNNNNTLCSSINRLKSDGGTNIEAGLILAKNLLNDGKVSDIANKNVILLTDGAPTYGVAGNEKNSTSTSVICENGNGMNGSGKRVSHDTHKGAETAAAELSKTGVAMYAVYVGNTKAKDVDCQGTGSCDLNKTGKDWLSADCGFKTYTADDTNLGELIDIFKSILNQIQHKAEAWVVTDPMGANISFKAFNREANPVNEFKSDNNTITWDIKSGSVPIEEKVGDETTYTYSLPYRIELDTLAEGYNANTSYATNGKTGSTYFVTTTKDGKESYDYGTAWFNIPSVKGFAGNLTFNKIDGFGAALPGATFELTTADKDGWKMEVTSGENGVVTFNNIPSGHTYTLKETAAPANYVKSNKTYEVTVSYGNVTVKEIKADGTKEVVTLDKVVNNSQTTTVHVAKVWNDANNQDGKRPESVQVQLKANGENFGEEVTLNADNGWAYDFDNLPQYKGGVAVTYTVEEVGTYEGYTAKVTGNMGAGFTITNSHVPETVDISGTKVWVDGNNQDGTRPQNIEISLYATGTTKAVAKQTISGTGNEWEYAFNNLPKYKDGKAIEYEVKEVVVPTGYTSKVTGNVANGFVVTNTHAVEKTSLSGTKGWDDGNNQDGIRPESVTINLLANGTKVGSTTATAANNWAWSFTGLDKNANGAKINYTIVEELAEGSVYAPVYNKDNTEVTNLYAPEKTTVRVSKDWNDDNNRDGARPEAVTVKLLANGTETGKTVVLNANNNWAASFDNLDKNAAGTAIAYTVAEATVNGYTPEITGDAVKGFTITNTHTPEKVSVAGSKTWEDYDNRDGMRPESITVNLLANGEEVAQKVVKADDDWAWNFENLYKYENGEKIEYTITEDDVEGYVTTVEGYDITNTHELTMEDITITKTWKGDTEKDRPKEIFVKVMSDGQLEETIVLTAKDNWTAVMNLPKYKYGEVGQPIVYSVVEEPVAGYTATIEGLNITNTKNPAAPGPNETQTGDNFNPWIFGGIGILALIAALAAFFTRRQTQK